MIINLRGTSGSGKTTIVQKIMALYDTKEEVRQEGRRYPIAYHCEKEGHKTLAVVGHYESTSGGCDSVPSLDMVYNLIRIANQLEMDVIYEGVMVSGEYQRCLQLRRDHLPLVVIRLSTSLNDCLDAIRRRRLEKGNVKEFNPARTIRRDKEVRSMTSKLESGGVAVYHLDRDAALIKCRELLGFGHPLF